VAQKDMKTLEVRTRLAWRKWLAKHHASEREIWLVFYKRHTGVAGLEYRDALEEALCYGWIDSVLRRLDDERYAHKFTPRKPGSNWSPTNRRLYARLRERGALAAPGIERAPNGRTPPARRPTAPDEVSTERNAMNDEFSNVYDDPRRADAYAKLEFPGTYYLAYRDLPAIIAEHVRGTRAVDFGCGAGRSTRFLRALGFDAVGVDISAPMVEKARELDPRGDYRVVPDGGLGSLPAGAYDLALSVFTFDNIPTVEKKVALFRSLGGLVNPTGRVVSLVSSPDIYVNEWASFTTKAFPGNRAAQSGDRVLIVMLDVEDGRPVEDVVWTDESYRDVYRRAGLALLATYRPLGASTEPYAWVSETSIAPWVIYVLERA
jgi:SAM-dependent methyltransferase